MRAIPVSLILVFTLLVSILIGLRKNTINSEINAVIKNEALDHFNQSPDELTEKEKIQAHLFYVYQILQDQNHEVEDHQLKLKRKAALASLLNYINAGEFPRNTAYEGRRPCFVDENNNLCAVAHLLHSDGQDELI